MTNKTVYCPVCKRQATGDECFHISMVAEGLAPSRFLPDDLKPETLKKQKETCIKCNYHPD